jgi:hypothetical protein
MTFTAVSSWERVVVAHLQPTPTHYGDMTILPQPHW